MNRYCITFVGGSYTYVQADSINDIQPPAHLAARIFSIVRVANSVNS